MTSTLRTTERLALGCYSLLTWLIQPLVRRKLERRAKEEPEYALLLPERFGHYQDARSAGWLWVHAVSLGETRAAALLIAELRLLHPQMKLLLTHSTATGWKAGQSLLAPGDRQTWLPWDTQGATQRFLDHFHPRLGVLIETEVWPNLVNACARQNVPLLLVNARLNESSWQSARRLSWLSKPAYQNLTQVLAQTEADGIRLTQLGAQRVDIAGNIKFDAKPNLDQLLAGKQWREISGKPILSLVSSREGEEKALVDALLSLKRNEAMNAQADCVQIMVVPRHPQRVDDVVNLFKMAGFSVSRRSQWVEHPLPADIWIGDSMGELAMYYAMSDMALLGGSFERFGGQNLIEAAASGCPLVMGPHTYNFEQASHWAEAAGAAYRAADMTSGVIMALSWIDQPQELEQAKKACQKFANAHQGTSRKTAETIFALLQSTPNS